MQRELIDAALDFLNQQALAIAFQPLGLELEFQAFLFESRVLNRVLVIQARGGQIVARLLEVATADGLGLPRILGALELTFRGVDGDLGHVGGLLVGEQAPAGLDALPGYGDFLTFERRLFTCQLVAQLRAVDRAEHLITLDRIAGLHVIGDIAGGGCEQGRADRRDHYPLCGNITYEWPPGDRGNAHALARHADLGMHPAQRSRKYDRRAGAVRRRPKR